MGVRVSIWLSDFIVGAGAPGGVRLPWAKASVAVARKPPTMSGTMVDRWFLFIVVFISISLFAPKVCPKRKRRDLLTPQNRH
jgi:hypothetical protein